MLTLIIWAFTDPAYVPPPHTACSSLCTMATCPIVHVSQESWHCQPQGWSSGEGEDGDSLAARPRTQRWLWAIRGTSHFPGFRAQRQSNFFHWEFQQLQLNMVVKELGKKKIKEFKKMRGSCLFFLEEKKQEEKGQLLSFLRCAWIILRGKRRKGDHIHFCIQNLRERHSHSHYVILLECEGLNGKNYLFLVTKYFLKKLKMLDLKT